MRDWLSHVTLLGLMRLSWLVVRLAQLPIYGYELLALLVLCRHISMG